MKIFVTSTSIYWFSSQPMNLYPKYLAALTSASSSGELALYSKVSWPSVST